MPVETMVLGIPFCTARRGVLRRLVPACLAIACSSDANCIYYPCAVPEAAEISVTASNAPAGIPGLTMSVSGSVSGVGPCNHDVGATSVCHVMGGPGEYQVELSAPGYQTSALKFTVTGTAAGCNTCGHVDLQRLSVVLSPK
jgi:hypothetical protein